MRSSITPLASRAGLAAVAGMTLVVGASPLLVSGRDHLDAPAAKADHRVDITDVYAFKAGAGHTTLVLNVDGLLTPADSKVGRRSGRDALYEIKIDRNQDGMADLAYRVRFSVADHQRRRQRDPGVRRPPGDGRRGRAQRVERQGRRDRPDHPVQARRQDGPRHGRRRRSSRASATTRSSSTCRASSTSRSSCSSGSTNLGTLLGGFTGDRHVRGDQHPLDRDPAAQREARRHRQLDRRVRDHLHPVQRRLEADRPRRPAGDQHRVQRADPARHAPTTTGSRRTPSTPSARRRTARPPPTT